MNKLKINTYTDESGQDTKGKTFVVCTVIIKSDKVDEIEKILLDIEEESDKNKKWYDSGDKRRHKYTKLLLQKRLLSLFDVFYSIYKNKQEYTKLVGAHIAKAVITHTKNQEYISKIFMDKMDKNTMLNLAKEIKSFHIRFKKIRGLTEESNAYIRLVDSLCGMIRDMGNTNIPNSYKTIFNKLKEI